MDDGRNPRDLRLAVLAGCALFAALAWKLDFLCDDAYISFRYSRNAAEGLGLRYNLTLGPPVEGYSNFLWVVWLAALDRVGLDITVWSRVSSALCGLLLVHGVTSLAWRRLDVGGLGALATALFCGSLPPVALWATGGLATMPTALFVFHAFERLLGDPARPRGWQAGVFAGLAALVRADGAAWILMLLGAGLLVWLARGRERPLLIAGLRTAGVLVVVVAAHVAWRYGYYGDVLPNTARVKAGFAWSRLERGLDYVAATLLTVPTIPLVLLLSLARWRRAALELWLPVVLLLFGTLAYGAYVGGDFMPMGRFLFPALALSPLLLALLWRGVRGGGSAAGLAALSGVLVVVNALGCFDVNLVPDSVRSRFHFRQDRKWESEVSMHDGMRQRAEDWAVLGKALALHTRPEETIVLGGMGAMGYYSRLEVYDTYGLVTPSVIGAVEPIERSSPGHDRRVGYTFFNDRHPTYAGALMSRVDAPPNDQLGNWEANPLAALTRIERYPLPVERGFAAGSELRLLRFLRWE